MITIYFAHDQQETPTTRRLILEMAGYKVSCFTSSVALLEALEQKLPDLLLMDVLIEGANGFETCRALRRKHHATELPVILSSSIYRSRVYRDEAVAVGAQNYLLQPTKPEDLLREINEALGLGSTSASGKS